MNVSTKTLLTFTILGTLGLGGIGNAYASQTKHTVPVTHQYRTSSQNQTSEVSNNDGGKTERATERLEQPKPRQTQETDKNEANEGPNDSDGGANEDAQ